MLFPTAWEKGIEGGGGAETAGDGVEAEDPRPPISDIEGACPEKQTSPTLVAGSW
jgi:hypothetical protein